MNERIKNLWVQALRSGKYTQGHGYLMRDDKFCCLGVLCDLAIKAGVPGINVTESGDGSGSMSYGYGLARSVVTLPPVVAAWAGVDEGDPQVYVEDATEEDAFPTLSFLNDERGYNFNQIADAIEAQL